MKIAAVTALAALGLAACASTPSATNLAENAKGHSGVVDASNYGGRAASYGELGLSKLPYINGDAYSHRLNNNDWPSGVLGYEPQYTVGPAHP